MIRSGVAEARVFQSWLDYQEALKRAIQPLSPNQLQHRPFPGRRTAGEIAEHIVFGRALHTSRALEGHADADALRPLIDWEKPADPARSASEIVEALDLSWGVIERFVKRGASMNEVDARYEAAAQVIWGLLDHDLPHAGQLSMVLRAAGLRGVEI